MIHRNNSVKMKTRAKSNIIKNSPSVTVKGKTNGEDSDTNSSVWSRLKMGYNPMEEGVRWTEKYADDLERMWRKTPGFLQKFIFVLAIALLGSSLKGEMEVFYLEQIFKSPQNIGIYIITAIKVPILNPLEIHP